jgi:hypothetical protein
MVATFSTSLIITQIAPNAGYKEIIVKTPSPMISAISCAVTLSDYGISTSGLITVNAFGLSGTIGRVFPETVTTKVSNGVLAILSSVTGNQNYPRVFRITGRAN